MAPVTVDLGLAFAVGVGSAGFIGLFLKNSLHEQSLTLTRVASGLSMNRSLSFDVSFDHNFS